MRLTTAAKVVFCTLIMIVGATGALSAAAATPNIDLTKGATIDSSTVEGGTVNGLITADNPDTDVQLFLDLDRDETVDSGEPTLTVSAGDLNSSGTAPFSGLSVPIGAENGKVDIIAVQRNSTLSVDDAVTPNITETTRLDAASDGRLVVDSDFDKGEFNTIQAAVNAASAGDTIEVATGTFPNSVTIDQPNLTLEGPNAGTPGASAERGAEAVITGQVIVEADTVVVDGLTVSPSDPGDDTTRSEAIRVSNSADNVVIQNNIVRDFARNSGSKDVFFGVDGINIFGGSASEAVESPTVQSNLVQRLNNTVFGGAAGISVQGNVNNATVERNTVQDIGQEVTAFGFGVVVRGTGNHDVTPSDVEVTDNEIANVVSDPDAETVGVGVGVEASGASDVNFTANSINNTGFLLEDKTGTVNLSEFASSNTLDRGALIENTTFGEPPRNVIFDSIGDADSGAPTGSQIDVLAGNYTESVTLTTRNLTLNGPNAGLAGDSDTRSDEALITQTETPTSGGAAIIITASNVTIDGFQIESDAQDGISVGQPVSDITIQNNRITSVTGNTFGSDSGQRATANGIAFGLPRSESEETVTGAIVRNNSISGVTTENLPANRDRTTANGIQVLTRQHNVKGMEITGNVISGLEAGSSGESGDKRARGIVINVGDDSGTIGAADEFEIANNEISNLTGAGGFSDAAGIALFEAGGAASDSQPRVGPENFSLTGNQLNNLANTGTDPAPAIFVGGIQSLGPDHTVSQNTITDGPVIRFAGDQTGFDREEADALNLSGNNFTDPDAEVYVSDSTPSANLTAVSQANEFATPPVEVTRENGARVLVPRTATRVRVQNLDQNTGFNSIQAAINNADPGDTIRVGPGEFQGPVQVVDGQTNLTIESTDGPGNTTINATDGNAQSVPSFNAQAVRISEDNVTIDGFNIVGDDTIVSGVFVGEGADNVSVTNNIIEGMERPGSGSGVDSFGIITASFQGDDDIIEGFVARNNTIQGIGNTDGNTDGDDTNGNGISLIDIAGNTAGDGAIIEENEISGLAGNGTNTGIAVQPLDRPTESSSNLDPGVALQDNTVSGSDVGLFLGDSGALDVTNNRLAENDISTSAPPDARIDATRGRSDIAAGDVPPVTTRLQTLLSNNDLATTAPATVANISLENPSARSLDLSVTTTGDVSGSTLSVALGNATNGTGSDVTIDEFAETENADGTFTYTASVEADVESGSVQTYEATVTEVDGNTDPDGVLPRSRSRTLAVAAFDGSTATVATGSTVVSEASIDLGDATGTTVSVSAVSTLPDTQEQSRSALQSDIDGVDDGDTVVSALDIDPGSSLADTNASLQFTIARTSIADPENLIVVRFTGTEYEPLPVTVVESDGTDVTLEAQTPGFSLFAIVETDGPSPTVGTGGSGGGGGAGGGGGGGAGGGGGGGGGAGISTDVSSGRPVDGVGPYTLRPSGSISEVTVTFDQPANGVIRASEVGGFPAEAPRFGGQVLAAVDIQAPSEAGPSTVRLSIPRSSVDDAGVLPSDLQIAHYEQDRGRIEPLSTAVVSANSQTVVLSAETPGFSVFAVVTQPARVTATPEPTATLEPTATPEATSERTTTTPTPDGGDQEPEPDEVTTSGRAPGFALTGTILSLLAAALIALRRR